MRRLYQDVRDVGIAKNRPNQLKSKVEKERGWRARNCGVSERGCAEMQQKVRTITDFVT